MSRNLCSIRYGSHLYGTATPQSDIDLKSVRVPAARDILLGRVKSSVSAKRAKATGERSFPGEVEEESYSLQRYLALLAEGQTVALDMLFAPDWACVASPAPEWREIRRNRHRLVSRKSAAFVAYCRQQANKYGIKGSRVAAARAALALLEAEIATRGTTAKLGEMADEIAACVAANAHMAVVDVALGSGVVLAHWEVCGRKLAFTASLKTGRDILAKTVAEYGHRALQAEASQGVDWKALSHAVRVADEAIELFRTGEIVFPLASAPHLLAIKTGALTYQQVAEEIEARLVEVEVEAARSTLRDSADMEWIDDFVCEIHRRECA